MRTDLGVGLRPPIGSLRADDWKVDAGAGGGGRLGNHDGYPSEASESLGGDADDCCPELSPRRCSPIGEFSDDVCPGGESEELLLDVELVGCGRDIRK